MSSHHVQSATHFHAEPHRSSSVSDCCQNSSNTSHHIDCINHSKIKSVAQVFSVAVESDYRSNAIPDELGSIGILELLESDQRAVFILDLTSTTRTIPIYRNFRARQADSHAIGDLTFSDRDSSKPFEFLAWALVESNSDYLISPAYCDTR